MPADSLTPSQILEFYKIAEKLKTVLRHSWLSDPARQESVAEHTWMMSLLAIVLLPKMQVKLDLTKVLKMIVIHDLAEAITKDMPAWESLANKAAKTKAEKLAITQIFSVLDEDSRAELTKLWEEYEERKSNEALFVKVMDTFDVIAQHNLADLASWDDNDRLWQLSPLQDAFFDFDPLFRRIKQKIDQDSLIRVKMKD
jgi:putative hydrolase of HD superfamily